MHRIIGNKTNTDPCGMAVIKEKVETEAYLSEEHMIAISKGLDSMPIIHTSTCAHTERGGREGRRKGEKKPMIGF